MERFSAFKNSKVIAVTLSTILSSRSTILSIMRKPWSTLTRDSRPWRGSMRVVRAGSGTIPWKFERTNLFRSLAFIRIRRDSHRQCIQDLCGGSPRSPGLDCMGSRAKDPWAEPSVEVLIAPCRARGGWGSSWQPPGKCLIIFKRQTNISESSVYSL